MIKIIIIGILLLSNFLKKRFTKSKKREIFSFDLHDTITKQAFFDSRVSTNELIVFAVGDTRDHRRVSKDPALSSISTDFIANVILNFKAMNINHFVVLASSAELCHTLQVRYPQVFDMFSCGYSSAYYNFNLKKWNMKKGDMFLLWMQQWLLVSEALQQGYGVMRVDSDVVFLENPYTILHGPLLKPFRIITQTDLFGPETRPICTKLAKKIGSLQLCKDNVPNALLNIGIIYFRSSENHFETPLYEFFKLLNNKFINMLRRSDGGNAEKLLDQPIFRDIMSSLYHGTFKVVQSDVDSVYVDKCPFSDLECRDIENERKKTAFSFVEIRKDQKTELLAGAPDWLFGRVCLRAFANGAQSIYSIPGPEDIVQYPVCPNEKKQLYAPGKSNRGGGLVAVHAVYTKAKKRVDAMKILGWWHLEEKMNSTKFDNCERGEQKNGIILTHTYFRQNPSGYRAFACAGQARGGCPCCVGLPEETKLTFLEYRPDDITVTVSKENNEKLQKVMHGCGQDINGGWNEFWN